MYYKRGQESPQIKQILVMKMRRNQTKVSFVHINLYYIFFLITLIIPTRKLVINLKTFTVVLGKKKKKKTLHKFKDSEEAHVGQNCEAIWNHVAYMRGVSYIWSTREHISQWDQRHGDDDDDIICGKWAPGYDCDHSLHAMCSPDQTIVTEIPLSICNMGSWER